MFSRARLKSIIINIKYFIWRLINPEKKFSDYYVKQVARTLDNRKPHATLGSTKTNPEFFDKSGEAHLKFLISSGMKNTSKVLDYGCGSLRVGRKLIEYLDSNKYYAFDITDRYYLAGLAGINPELIKEKNPQFFVISDESIRKVSEQHRFQFIISTGVLIHIPKDELNEYFVKIISFMNEQTKAYIYFQEGGKYFQTGPITWEHSTDYLQDLVEQLGCKCSFTQDEYFLALPGRKKKNHRILVMSNGLN